MNGYQLFYKEETRQDCKNINVLSAIMFSSLTLTESFEYQSSIDTLKAMTFNERNIEVARRWKSLEQSERDNFITQSNVDVTILDNETRTKRQLKKIKNAVC